MEHRLADLVDLAYFSSNVHTTPQIGETSTLSLDDIQGMIAACGSSLNNGDTSVHIERMDLFGVYHGDRISRITDSVFNTTKPVCVEERASHLIYHFIRSRPLLAGNKLIGSYIFLQYLRINIPRLVVSYAAITALTHLIDESRDDMQEQILGLIQSLVGEWAGVVGGTL